MPVALHTSERIAVPVHIKATDEEAALGVALNGLRGALPEVGLTELRVVRAEVMTGTEFHRDCQRAYGATSSAAARDF